MTTRARLRERLSKIRPALLLISLLSALAIFGMQRGLSPWDLARRWDGIGLLAWGPSFFYALSLAIFFLSLRTRTPEQNAIFVVCGAFAYEAIQVTMPAQTVDWRDFLATVIALPVAIAPGRVLKAHEGH